MPTFRYQALNAEQQIVAGHVEAEGVQQAIAQLEASGLAVQSIGFASVTGDEEPSRVIGPSRSPRREPLPPNMSLAQEALESHLAKVMPQSQTLVPALRAYADELPAGGRRNQLLEVCHILDSGDARTAGGALAELPEFWIPLLSAASASNAPGRVLQEFLAESQRADDLRRQWRVTLAYPLTIVALTGGVLVAFSFLIVPMFLDIFTDFDLRLPQAIMALLNSSRFITTHWPAILVVLAVLILVVGNRRRMIPVAWRQWAGNWFVFGRSTALAQFARFTTDLLEAGLSVPDALRIAGLASRRRALQGAGWRLAAELDAGRGGSRPDFERPLSATVLYALQAEMAPSSRVRLLKELSGAYADRAERWWSWTRGVLEPLAILAIGIVVLLAVAALFMPLVSLINNLSG